MTLACRERSDLWVSTSLVIFDVTCWLYQRQGPLVVFDPGFARAAGSYGGEALAAVFFGGTFFVRILCVVIYRILKINLSMCKIISVPTK